MGSGACDRQTDRQADRQTDRETDRQTDLESDVNSDNAHDWYILRNSNQNGVRQLTSI